MNERIEALKKLATKEVWGNNPYNGSPEFDGYELDADMFAELIVKECVHQVLTGIKCNPPQAEPPAIAKTLAQRLQQHFGVKE